MMKSFLLFILSLMTGCRASIEVRGCQGGWVEFTCKYPESDAQYKIVRLIRQDKMNEKITEKDKWVKRGRFSFYHDTKNELFNVTITNLNDQDSGEYKCKFKSSEGKNDKRKVSLYVNEDIEDETAHSALVDLGREDFCMEPSSETETADITAEATITCDYPVGMESGVKFFCKDNEFNCKEILSAEPSPVSKGRFTATETNGGFTISISDVSSRDAGVYWCGVDTGIYRASVKQIHLEVKDSPTYSYYLTTQSTTVTSPIAGGSWLTVIIAVVVSVVLLLLVLILVFVYKRNECTRSTKKGEEENNKEDRTYEEILEPPQVKDSGTAITTIYTTANFPTDSSSASHLYSNKFLTGSVEVSGADTYSTVRKNDQNAPYSTVNHPSGPSGEASYCTVNRPQQP